MATRILTHLMFEGVAEEAMNLYVGLFPRSRIIDLSRYEEGPKEGKVETARFSLNDCEFICIDSPINHDFGFTPAMSIFIDCESGKELDRLFSVLSENGEILMPVDKYGFSQKFGWVKDRYGVSWQINLP